MIKKTEIENLFAQALDFCSQKSRKTTQEIVSLLRQGDLWTNSTLRYALAKYLCENCLPIHTDSVIKAVYIYGSSLNDEAHLNSDIDLVILVVGNKKQALEFLRVLDYDILTYYKSLVGEQAKDMRSILDVHLVNDEEVRESRGYGAVINSIHNPPIKIWTNSKDDKIKNLSSF